jgi:RHS repeat-associated protein
LIADQAGNTVWRNDNTEPFGDSVPNNNTSGLGAFEFNLRFPGQYFDRETGVLYNLARNYSPEIGRYVESDPIGLYGGVLSACPTSEFVGIGTAFLRFLTSY